MRQSIRGDWHQRNERLNSQLVRKLWYDLGNDYNLTGKSACCIVREINTKQAKTGRLWRKR